MRLLDMLEVLGDRLGILQTAEDASSAAPLKIQTRTITLVELTTEIRSEEVRALAELPAELTVLFEEVFKSAGIATPPHGWNTERLKHLLHTDPYKGLERREIQKKLQETLGSEKVNIEDIVKEAIARDRAIDAFESFVRSKMEARISARERKIAELESRIQELQREVAAEKEKAKADSDNWREWHNRKRAYEQELAWVTGHLIDRQVVTIDDEEF